MPAAEAAEVGTSVGGGFVAAGFDEPAAWTGLLVLLESVAVTPDGTAAAAETGVEDVGNPSSGTTRRTSCSAGPWDTQCVP